MTPDDKIDLAGVAFILFLLGMHVIAVTDDPDIKAALDMRAKVQTMIEAGTPPRRTEE